MDPTASGRTWDDASSPAATRLARRYETAWRNASGPRPSPYDYLPADPSERPGALLALLRTDLALRWEEGRDPVQVEWYRDRHPDLNNDGLVALIYEEFCLREEAGEAPDQGEYLARFPHVTALLRRVFDIHGLVGSVPAAAFQPAAAPAVPFPEVGQTIAGFHLVEELGRGTFARVFCAEERQLADRPVALKVARGGSREPQTLARLQHTNIVPVHSYRTDPATGLHLLCMPYFGKVTLAQILADPATRTARTGADLVAVLDRLQPPSRKPPQVTTARTALSRRTYASAIAWWGARMAEALQHAHDRGVLHRDIKPSNVLVTAEGMPMLLDFNLAHESWVDDPTAAAGALGGTLAYMAPEHLEALADGGEGRVDARADLYALGVVLYEALGSRPFAAPTAALTISEAMLRAAEDRRRGTISLRVKHPDVPPALDAVVMKCLAPEPDDRYATAAELAADLQAVADDGPLRFAREPQPSRTYRWLRRNKRRLAAATAVLVPAAAALAIIASTTIQAKVDRVLLESKVKERIDSGKSLVDREDYDGAMFQFGLATQMAERKPGLENLFSLASEQYFKTDETRKIRAQADTLFREADSLRFLLLNSRIEREAPANDFRETKRNVESALEPFYVFANRDWARRPELTLLDTRRRERLPEDVNEILFLWAWAFDRWATGMRAPHDTELIRGAVQTCDWALQFTSQRQPWEALRAHYARRLANQPALAEKWADPGAEASARACFQWSLLSDLEGRRDWAIAWLERAVLIEPGNYWYQFYLATNHERAGHFDQAREHFDAAVVANPDSPWARRNRAHLYWSRGAWDRALADLQVAINKAGKANFEFTEAHLDLGCVYQAIGDEQRARAEYDHVIARGKGSAYVTAARQNRAKLQYDAGRLAEAMAEFDALLAENSDDASARLGRAMLLLRLRQAGRAEADLTHLIEQPRTAQENLVAADFRLQALELRALSRLASGQVAAAEADAAEAFRLEASPSHERLWARALLALGEERRIHVEDPAEIALWPAAGPALNADLRAAADRLRQPAPGEKVAAPAHLLTRSVFLSALRDPAALVEADRAVERAGSSASALLVRSRIRRRAGDRAGAWHDVSLGLSAQPEEPRLLELRGRLELENGSPEEALADLNRAIRRGASGSVRSARAQAFTALGRYAEALDDWTLALAHDPEDPHVYLGRARAFLRLRKFDQALADLEQAASWAGEDTELLVPMTLTYASCLTERPNRIRRVLALARRSWLAATAPLTPRATRNALSGL